MSDEPARSDANGPPRDVTASSDNESPEILALQKDGATWSASRRAFIKGTATASVTAIAGCSGCPKQGEKEDQGTPLAHRGKVTRMLLTPGKDRLITGGEDAQVKIWDLPSGNLSRTLSGMASNVTALAISGDGHRLAAGDVNGTIKLWSLPGLGDLRTINWTGAIDGLFLGADGSQLYLRQGSTISVLRFRNQGPGGGVEEVGRAESINEPNLSRHTFVRQGASVVSLTVCNDGAIRQRALPGGAESRTFQRKTRRSVNSLTTSPSGAVVALHISPRDVEVWSLKEGKLLAEATLPTNPNAIKLLSDTTLAVLAGRGLITYTIKPPRLEVAETIELKADDDKPPDGPSPPSSDNPPFEVDVELKVVIEARHNRVSSWSLGDGKRQIAFRDPVISKPKPKPAPRGGGGGRGGGGHYWRPN